MKKMKIGVIDLTAQGPTKALWARVMNANFASIMPQSVAVWCQQEGHDVRYLCYTGLEDLTSSLPHDMDLVFIGAFTEAAQLAYSLSALLRSRGAVTVIGGPHARCYPQDAALYFDYVLGFTDRELIRDVIKEAAPHRPLGKILSAVGQPDDLPGVEERWPFISAALKGAPFFKMVPMIGSLGCPYSCSFCIDSEVPYQPLDPAGLKDDLTFLLTKFRRPVVAFHDPNFGVQFDKTMDAIESAARPGSVEFVAESSLSLLSEPHLIRMKRNGFKGLLPGVESWFQMGEKSHTGQRRGIDKVREVADHVNLIQRYVPYLQANFVLGLDADEGEEPFELTKRFIDLAPGAFPGYSLLSAFGQAAPANLQYQQDGRVIAFPFHFLNNHGAMNIEPRNYSWKGYYRHVIDLTRYSFSARAVARRAIAARASVPRWLNVVRAMSTEGAGRIAYYSEILRHLETDPQFNPFFHRVSGKVPDFYVERIRKDLGEMWRWLPEGAVHHDPNAYLKSSIRGTGMIAEARRAG
jgi:hypothetical protein